MLVALAGGCEHAGAPPLRPAHSLLLIVVDTLRADHLGVYGYGPPTSPVIDALASTAVVFEEATTPAPLTMPATAAIMTGVYPDRLGVINHTRRDRLDAAVPTLAERAAAAGYATAAVVANPWLAHRPMGFDRGFTRFVNKRSTAAAGRLDAREVTDLAIALLDGAPRQPLLLWVQYIDTHMPYSPPAEVAALFGNTAASSAVVDDFRSAKTSRQAIYFDGAYEEVDLEATRQLYDASIRHVDTQIGRLLDALAASGRERQTIVVLLSDHGESLGDHGLFFAHDFTLYEELLHVPLLIRVPGRQPHRVGGEVSLVDLTPTLCVLMRLACPERLDGQPLALDRVAGQAGARTVFAANAPARARYDRNPWLHLAGAGGRWTMAKRNGLKLIRIPHRDAPRWQAYDLRSDPAELVDIYDPRRFFGLARELAAWQGAVATTRDGLSSRPAHLGRPTREALRALGYLD